MLAYSICEKGKWSMVYYYSAEKMAGISLLSTTRNRELNEASLEVMSNRENPRRRKRNMISRYEMRVDEML